MTTFRISGLAAALVAALAFAGGAMAQEPKSKPLPTATDAPKAKAGGIRVTTPWARATPGGARIGVAFLTMSAPAGAADKLLAARSPVAGAVELHTHMESNGVMQMRRVDAIPVAAGGTVTLKPGGLHIMLMELKGPLKEGETIALTLVFEKAGEVEVGVPVLKVGSPGPNGAGTPAKGQGGHGAHGKH